MSLNLTAEVRPVPEMWPWEPRLYHSFVTYFMMFPKGKKQRNGIIQSFFAGDSCGLVPGGEGRLGVDKPTPGFLLLGCTELISVLSGAQGCKAVVVGIW